MNNELNHELRRLRKRADKLGYAILRGKCGLAGCQEPIGYMIASLSPYSIVCGGTCVPYDLTLDAVREFLDDAETAAWE